jgi:hypothetical protein
MVTRYLPRATCSARVIFFGCGAATGREAFAATITASDVTRIAAVMTIFSLRVTECIVSSVLVAVQGRRARLPAVYRGDYRRAFTDV